MLKFFLNSKTTGYLRHLESEFGESTNAIRQELNRFEEAGMLSSGFEGNKKVFRANTRHPLFEEVHNILMKYVGLDKIVDHVIKRLGNVEQVFLTGKMAQGLESPVIDLVIVGTPDKAYLIELIDKAEALINRKVRYLIYSPEDFERSSSIYDAPHLLLWAATT